MCLIPAAIGGLIGGKRGAMTGAGLGLGGVGGALIGNALGKKKKKPDQPAQGPLTVQGTTTPAFGLGG